MFKNRLCILFYVIQLSNYINCLPLTNESEDIDIIDHTNFEKYKYEIGFPNIKPEDKQKPENQVRLEGDKKYPEFIKRNKTDYDTTRLNKVVNFTKNFEDSKDDKSMFDDLRVKYNGKVSYGSYYWTIRRYPSKIGDMVAWMTVRQALEFWENVSSLRFIYIEPYYDADVNVIFGDEFHYNSQGSLCKFDNSDILGHAYYPTTELSGDIHINNLHKYFGEKNSETSYSLLHLLIHEIGHVLGLRHNNRTTSIMYPYEYPNRHIRIQKNILDDIDKRSLY